MLSRVSVNGVPSGAVPWMVQASEVEPSPTRSNATSSTPRMLKAEMIGMSMKDGPTSRLLTTSVSPDRTRSGPRSGFAIVALIGVRSGESPLMPRMPANRSCSILPWSPVTLAILNPPKIWLGSLITASTSGAMVAVLNSADAALTASASDPAPPASSVATRTVTRASRPRISQLEYDVVRSCAAAGAASSTSASSAPFTGARPRRRRARGAGRGTRGARPRRGAGGIRRAPRRRSRRGAAPTRCHAR